MSVVFGRQLDTDDMVTVYQAVADFHAESRYPVIFDFEPNPVQVVPILGRRALASLGELRSSSDFAEEQYQKYMSRPVSRQDIPLQIGLILYMNLQSDGWLDSEERIVRAATARGCDPSMIQKLSLPLALPEGVQVIDRKFVRWLEQNGIEDIKHRPAPQDVAWTTLLGEDRRSNGMFKPRMALMGAISRAIQVVRSGPIELVEIPDAIA